jgi:hypothetical protein
MSSIVVLLCAALVAHLSSSLDFVHWNEDQKDSSNSIKERQNLPEYNDTSILTGMYTNTASGYEKAVAAYVSLFHSEAAYCLPGNSDYRWDDNGYTKSFQLVKEIQQGSTFGYIGFQSDIEYIIVSFRGTNDVQNWVTNLDFFTTEYPLCSEGDSNCRVHSGFYAAEQSVIGEIFDEVDKLRSKYPNWKILCTGHSLGAALATLAALDLQNHFKDSHVELFNYGSPRLFNLNAANYASSGVLKTIYRRTHYKDIVPHTPPHATGFQHIAGEVYENGPIKTYPDPPGGPLQSCEGEEDPNCADQYNGASVSDHLLYSGLAMGTGNACTNVEDFHFKYET